MIVALVAVVLQTQSTCVSKPAAQVVQRWAAAAARAHAIACEKLAPNIPGFAIAVAVDGRIVLSEESNVLREKLKSLIAEGKKKIVLNMDNITYIDSAGLGILVAAHCSAKTRGASLLLCHLGRKFKEVLQITKLLTVFEVCDTEAAAVASFSR